MDLVHKNKTYTVWRKNEYTDKNNDDDENLRKRVVSYREKESGTLGYDIPLWYQGIVIREKILKNFVKILWAS